MCLQIMPSFLSGILLLSSFALLTKSVAKVDTEKAVVSVTGSVCDGACACSEVVLDRKVRLFQFIPG